MNTEVATASSVYRDAVRAEWTDDSTVAGWRKWHSKIAVQQQAMTDSLLEAAGIRTGISVLDIGSGTGHPALDLARAVGPSGSVIASDLSPAMLSVAKDNAIQAGLTNIRFHQADAENLPFADESFDAITSRLGAMYFVDIQQALSEIHRVLKPGGRLALVVWGPGDQGSYVAGMLGPFFSRIYLPTPDPAAPAPFRFAAPGALSGELGRAGFRQIEEQTLVIPAPWPGTPEEYWQQFYDVAVPMRPVFDSLGSADFAQAKREAEDLLRAEYDGATVNATVAIVVAAGAK